MCCHLFNLALQLAVKRRLKEQCYYGVFSQKDIYFCALGRMVLLSLGRLCSEMKRAALLCCTGREGGYLAGQMGQLSLESQTQNIPRRDTLWRKKGGHSRRPEIVGLCRVFALDRTWLESWCYRQ